LAYGDLSKAFPRNDIGRLSLPKIREKVLEVRAGKFPDLAKEGTAGSFFLNPVVTADVAAALVQKYPGLPHFPAEGGLQGGKAGTKLSLAWLLDHALGVKGMHEGGARLYEKQPLVIVAARDARAADVRALAEQIKKIVREKLQLQIEEEVRIIF
jgi:UDP-N-acetylmuramate dehydrogenase